MGLQREKMNVMMVGERKGINPNPSTDASKSGQTSMFFDSSNEVSIL